MGTVLFIVGWYSIPAPMHYTPATLSPFPGYGNPKGLPRVPWDSEGERAESLQLKTTGIEYASGTPNFLCLEAPPGERPPIRLYFSVVLAGLRTNPMLGQPQDSPLPVPKFTAHGLDT